MEKTKKYSKYTINIELSAQDDGNIQEIYYIFNNTLDFIRKESILKNLVVNRLGLNKNNENENAFIQK